MVDNRRTMDSVPTPTLQQASRRKAGAPFWRLMYQAVIVAGGTHLIFIPLFYALDATTLAWANVGSVVLFTASYVCLRRHANLLGLALAAFEIFAHATLAVRAIGWESGFHYYLLLAAPVVVIGQTRGRYARHLLIGSLLLFYVALDYAMHDLTPYHLLAKEVITIMRYVNVTVTLLLLAYLSHVYMTLVTQAETRLLHLAATDPLTQLLNRRSLLDIADYELTQRQRHQAPLAFVLGDIDHFKSINDQYGHAAGDAVLVAVSQTLKQTVRRQDSVARWGGEEFLVLMPGATPDTAHIVAERLRERVSALKVPFGGTEIQVSLTFGVGNHRTNEPVDAPINRADAALYRGKVAGRNRVIAEAV